MLKAIFHFCSWLCCYMSQMNPLIGPVLNQRSLFAVKKFWVTKPVYFDKHNIQYLFAPKAYHKIIFTKSITNQSLTSKSFCFRMAGRYPPRKPQPENFPHVASFSKSVFSARIHEVMHSYLEWFIYCYRCVCPFEPGNHFSEIKLYPSPMIGLILFIH